MVMASTIWVHGLSAYPRVASQQGLSFVTIDTKPTNYLLNEAE